MTSGVKPEGIVLGACLVALGVIGTLGNLGLVDALATLRTWWPASLVLWGGIEILAALFRRSPGGEK